MVESAVWEANAQVPKRAWRKQYLPNVETLPGNCMAGQLTVQGSLQHRALGQNLRALYVDALAVLPPSLDPTGTRMVFRSTDIPRTIQSAWNLVEGAWPNSSGLYSLMTMDLGQENMSGGNLVACPALQDALSARRRSGTAYANYTDPKVAPFIKKYSALYNMTLDYQGLDAMNDLLRARVCHGFPFPLQMSDAVSSTICFLKNVTHMPPGCL